MSQIKSVISGLQFIILGFELLKKNKNLRKWALIPFVIDLLLVLIGFFTGTSLINNWLMSFMVPQIKETLAYNLLYYPLLIIFGFIFLLLWTYFVFIISSLIAGPFNGILAERTLMELGVIQHRKLDFKKSLKIAASLFLTGIVKILFFTLFAIVLFLLAFIPGLNLVSTFGALFVMAFDSLDYSYEVLELNFRERIRLYKSQFSQVFGMSMGFGATFLIPGLTLLLMPAAVVGGAILVSKKTDLRRKFD